MVLFRYAFIEFTIFDLLDILILSVVVYSTLKLIRGTRSLSMAIGLALLILTALVSSWLNMEALNWLIRRLSAIWLLAFIVIFQPELRAMLTTIGNSKIVRMFIPSQEEQNIEDIIEAIEVLQKASTGALIVMKRNMNLSSVEQTGKMINAKLTSDLLVTIFAPLTPLHDGAVIVDKDKIVAAACQLPMTDNPKYQSDLGMRHRAAIGLSEETDAVSIIVSEETGGISMALRGNLRRDLTIDTLQKLLKIIVTNRKS